MNQEKDETLSVIDGNQRLRSLSRFIKNEFSLVGLTSYPELSGLTYEKLDVRFQRHIASRVLRCTVILKDTHPQVKFDVFERLNSGAVALTRQELRHGLYFGTLLKKASSVVKELKIEGLFGKRKDKRMKAEELVIRYWALSSNLDNYEKPLATFISNFAEENRNLDELELDKLGRDIEISHALAKRLFGPHCFTFTKDGNPRFNAAVFDAQMVACSKCSGAKYRKLDERIVEIRKAYETLENLPEYSRSVTLATSDKAALLGRITAVSNLLKSFA